MIKKSVLIIFIYLNPVSAYPHAGGLNDDGCHTNNENRNYHCHGDKKKDLDDVELIGSDKCIKRIKSLAKGSVCEGRVVGISDGDTITLLVDKNTYKIRLAQIDTPEKKQPFGMKSKKILSDLIYKKDVRAQVETVDRYDRSVADIYLDDKHINAELVRLGAAWVYRKYARDSNLYMLESKAKKEQKGLWGLSDSDIVAPWDWRKK